MATLLSASGIRDGDPAVLAALVERRGAAVLAFTEKACAPGLEVEAAAEAFARFRATVIVADDPASLDPEATLLSATRHASAGRIPRPVAAPGGPLGRLLGGQAGPDVASIVPALLVARADGTLDASGAAQLSELLSSSAAARAVDERFQVAERAYRVAPARLTDRGLIDELVDAMATEAVPQTSAEEPSAAIVTPDVPAIAETDGGSPAHEAALPEEPVALDEPPPIEEPALVDDVPQVEEPEEPEAVAEPDEAEAEAEADDTPEDLPEPEVDEELVDERQDDEWTIPPDQFGAAGDLELEIAAARLHPEPDEDAEHIQTASGAVDEGLVAEDNHDHTHEVSLGTAGPDDPHPPVMTTVPAEDEPVIHAPSPAPQRARPGRGALAAAATVIVIAALGAMAAGGVFGGKAAQPEIDTGLVPKRPPIEVPDGQAGAVVDDLRERANGARRERLAARRQANRRP